LGSLVKFPASSTRFRSGIRKSIGYTPFVHLKRPDDQFKEVPHP
jgi:hypothetical protein